MLKTPQQIANLKDALYNMWPSIPEESVARRLGRWSHKEVDNTHIASGAKPPCGSTACFGGWCTTWPNFRAQGLYGSFSGCPQIDNSEEDTEAGLVVAETLFGDWRLFAERCDHPADKGFIGSDHALVINRLKWALAQEEVAE